MRQGTTGGKISYVAAVIDSSYLITVIQSKTKAREWYCNCVLMSIVLNVISLKPKVLQPLTHGFQQQPHSAGSFLLELSRFSQLLSAMPDMLQYQLPYLLTVLLPLSTLLLWSEQPNIFVCDKFKLQQHIFVLLVRESYLLPLISSRKSAFGEDGFGRLHKGYLENTGQVHSACILVEYLLKPTAIIEVRLYKQQKVERDATIAFSIN
ncbi:hypothetical protein C5167_004680 [Papaver somniferum]|uniref:Uncharacterized protein n=1 Tax=Papaver somniferum TaxID=3469 RepID=A0A4Y7JA52_PAPSO|nr:hypothetical protein C5167_004680 [Papaver somniferum]